jgi:hypothetical protein
MPALEVHRTRPRPALRPARARDGWLRSPRPAGTRVRVRSTHRWASDRQPPPAYDAGQAYACGRWRTPRTPCRARITRPQGCPGSAAKPGHPVFVSARSSQPLLRRFRSRLVALGWLSLPVKRTGSTRMSFPTLAKSIAYRAALRASPRGILRWVDYTSRWSIPLRHRQRPGSPS